MASLLEQHLSEELYNRLVGRETSSGFTIDDVIRSGRENPDSSVGVYAGDAESYEQDHFGEFFDKVISAYHKFGAESVHREDLDLSKLAHLTDLDPEGKYIVSTRIRVGRNLRGYPFAPAISTAQRAEVERKIVNELHGLEGDLKGEYYPLEGMSPEVQERMIKDHFLFKEGDRFLASAGANRDWPKSRGIFHTPKKDFLVWVNEEDQLRIISMEKGGDIRGVFSRLVRAIKAIEARLPLAKHSRYGALSSCPTNLGTAMRASVHVRIPNLSKTNDFKSYCESMELSVRGIHGEHSESEGGVYDISNKRRLGLSEVDAVLTMYEGVKELIARERALEQA